MDKRYQVFVSSTYSDLRAERSAIIQALMQMDCIPAGMELFPAADEEQFEFIKRIIDDCDYYILIVGGRYGSTAADGASYTEKEYDYARRKGLPVFSFVHERPQSLEPEKCERDPETLAQLERFRQKVKTGKMVKLWSDPKELPGLVAISLSKGIKMHPAVGWVRGDQVANVQLLNELNELRKRNEELETQVREMAPDIGGIAGLDDTIELAGTFRSSSSLDSYERKMKLTWGELFAAIAPDIIGQPNDLLMRSAFTDRMKALHRKENRYSSGSWYVRDEDYQTAKIQLMALKLVRVEMEPTSDGGSALFWSLAPLGEAAMLELRTVKKAN